MKLRYDLDKIRNHGDLNHGDWWGSKFRLGEFFPKVVQWNADVSTRCSRDKHNNATTLYLTATYSGRRRVQIIITTIQII